MSCTIYSINQLSLMFCASTCNSSWENLSSLRNELSQCLFIFIAYRRCTFSTELAGSFLSWLKSCLSVFSIFFIVCFLLLFNWHYCFLLLNLSKWEFVIISRTFNVHKTIHNRSTAFLRSSWNYLTILWSISKFLILNNYISCWNFLSVLISELS